MGVVHMGTVLFEHLERAGTISRGRLRPRRLFSMPHAELLDLLDLTTAATALPDQPIRATIRTHVASFVMGGCGDECVNFHCRLRDLDELARFAALYSDQVIIHNYLATSAPSWGHLGSVDTPESRRRVADDIQLLLHIRPLIRSGRILLLTPTANLCPYCYAHKVFGTKADQRLRRAMRLLAGQLRRDMTVEFYKDEDGYAAACHGTRNLFRHESHVMSFDALPSPFSARPRLANRVEAGDVVALSRSVATELGLHKDLAEDVLCSLRYQMSVADTIRASFTSNREVDIKVLSLVSDDSEIDRRNAIAARHLKSIVPFLPEVPVADLLRLRQREGDAFVRYRAALDSVLTEFTGEGSTLSDRRAQAIYADIIQPELASLNSRVKDAKRDLIKAPLAAIAGASAALIFGVYLGMLPAELGEAAAALGLSKAVYDAAAKAAEIADVQRAIRPERFYFLWKVAQIGRSRSLRHQ
jgi:hypothetical protein